MNTYYLICVKTKNNLSKYCYYVFVKVTTYGTSITIHLKTHLVYGTDEHVSGQGVIRNFFVSGSVLEHVTQKVHSAFGFI